MALNDAAEILILFMSYLELSELDKVTGGVGGLGLHTGLLMHCLPVFCPELLYSVTYLLSVLTWVHQGEGL